MKYIQFILIFIAGIGKGIMDTLQFHYSTSIFYNINPQWYDPSISWTNKLHTWLPDTFTDCWHLSQSLFLESIFIAIIIYTPIVKWNSQSLWWTKVIDFLILRVVFGAAFVLCYNYILIK